MSQNKIVIPLEELAKAMRDSGLMDGKHGCDDEITPDGLISVLDNHIFFYADVTPITTLRLTNVMTRLRNEILSEAAVKGRSPEEIHIHINSPGGLATSGFMMYDNITSISEKVPVWTHIEGQVSSAATLLSIAGTKRFITPSSFMLIHEMRSFFVGTMKEISEEYRNLLKFEEKYINIYLKHSNFEKEELKTFLSRDSILTAEEALERKLVDEISTQVY